jgi:hypothetical protein
MLLVRFSLRFSQPDHSIGDDTNSISIDRRDRPLPLAGEATDTSRE